jgi:LPS-assembly protein
LRLFFRPYLYSRSSEIRIVFSTLSIAIFCLTCPANALETGSEPWSLEADRIISQSAPLKIVAEGDVVIRHREEGRNLPLEIKADSATFRARESELDVNGNVSLHAESGVVSAGSVILNLKDGSAKLSSTSIFLADQELSFKGRLVEKIGRNRYLFYDGLATSCRIRENRATPWSISWSKGDITVDGMAFLKSATFRVKNIPLFYFPYLVLPAKVSRQSGFLLPEISSSDRDGAGVIAPLFINLSPSTDLTLYPGYYDKRGASYGLEFRHVEDFDSRMTLIGNYLHDRTVDPGPPFSEEDYRQDGYLRDEHYRYWVRGKLNHFFTPTSAVHLDIDGVSDQDFIQEYRDGITGFTKNNSDFLTDFNRGLQDASLNFRESIFQLTNNEAHRNSGLELRYVDDPLARLTGTEPVHTLPRILFNSRRPVGSWPLSLGWESEYVYYRPEEGIGYQRVDLLPKLVAPMPLGRMLEGTISGGLRETFYRVENIGQPATPWTIGKTPNRSSRLFTANIATALVRDFRTGNESYLTHTFRPNLRYDYDDNDHQLDLPDLDAVDRLSDRNSLTLELNNYFKSDRHSDDVVSRQIGHLKLSQSYDLDEERRLLAGPTDKRRPFSELAMDLEFRPTEDMYLRYKTSFNVYGEGVTAYELKGRYTNNMDDLLQVDYSFRKGVSSDLKISSAIRLTGKFSARYNTTRSLYNDHKTSESLGLVYSPQCWSVELATTEDSDNRRLMLTFTMTGIGEALAMSHSN